MARYHGKEARVYLGARDASSDLAKVELTASAETHDVTTFGASWRAYDPGLGMWEASVEGFYDAAAGGIGRQFETLLGSTSAALGVVSLYHGDADAVGDQGWLGSEATLSERGQPVSVSDIVRLTGKLTGSGRVALAGRLLSPLTTVSTTTNGTSLDNTASTANGGRANLHITTATGTGGTIKVQHSADNSTWVDLITFTAAAAATSETKTVTGTVNRYLRSVATINATSSLTFVVGFGRY